MEINSKSADFLNWIQIYLIEFKQKSAAALEFGDAKMVKFVDVAPDSISLEYGSVRLQMIRVVVITSWLTPAHWRLINPASRYSAQHSQFGTRNGTVRHISVFIFNGNENTKQTTKTHLVAFGWCAKQKIHSNSLFGGNGTMPLFGADAKR